VNVEYCFLFWCGGMFELQLFEKVEVDKPAASRSESAEVYILGLKYLAPAKIDPRILDFRRLAG
jgi:AdoMet-dependent rRNA methyltransferase SPB1